ncbi:hypothetical protein GCM10011374_03560 [Kocuria dechangensis]|uniref:Uncharacterized protein n=1 Tax=Kocuria dechangensis TaxID=1176249 RepID=A0A917LMD7_9MICC|nr:hypothetical protein GCM10011374_03560 [Kocuria dechangensis]
MRRDPWAGPSSDSIVPHAPGTHPDRGRDSPDAGRAGRGRDSGSGRHGPRGPAQKSWTGFTMSA